MNDECFFGQQIYYQQNSFDSIAVLAVARTVNRQLSTVH